MSGRLDGLSFLIVEDEYLIAWELSRFVNESGGEVIGPVPDAAAAMGTLAKRRPDCVLLDVDLGGTRSDAVAAFLQDAGIPFVFTTGYDRKAIDARFAGVPHLEKPIGPAELHEALCSVATLSRPG